MATLLAFLALALLAGTCYLIHARSAATVEAADESAWHG